ncbi:MAG: hypothetical protein KatS3mg032_1380 [Cyclobacteriaceae bacterium]|nr:MAG: hypothetical protein KatS3mg032_1380 [Cyclobacteriaceae bacterium]
MMRVLSFGMLLLVASCSKPQTPEAYFGKSQQDSLLTDIITYLYVRPAGADWQSRFDPAFRKYYVSNLSKFTWKKLHRDPSGTYYFYLIRPARSSEGALRGVGGTFRLDGAGKIIRFREVFNTPVGSRTFLEQTGEQLFAHMIKHGNVEAYLLNDALLEWPNAWTYYDTIRYEWLVKPGI